MKIINAVAGGTGNSTAQIRAGENYLRESHNDVNTKTGTTWQAENAYRLGSSFWSKAKGTNEVGDLLSANTTGSYIIMSKGQMKNALMGYDEE
jgi:hypothetical protein